MNSEEFETVINRKLIVDQVASLLYATGVVPHSKEVTNIQFSNLFGPGQDEFTTMKIFTKEVNN